MAAAIITNACTAGASFVGIVVPLTQYKASLFVAQHAARVLGAGGQIGNF